MDETNKSTGAKKPTRAEANRKMLTEDNVLTLPLKSKQYIVWDGAMASDPASACADWGALSVQPEPRSSRGIYCFPGLPKPHNRHLSRVGIMSLEEARDHCRKDQKQAKEGIDPKADHPSKSDSYKAAVDDYIQPVQINQDKRVSAEEARRVEPRSRALEGSSARRSARI